MTNPELAHVEFVLDRSGSMHSIKTDIEGGFDAFIADQTTQPGRCTASLAQFDNEYGRATSREAYAATSVLSRKLKEATWAGAPLASVAFSAEDRASTRE